MKGSSESAKNKVMSALPVCLISKAAMPYQTTGIEHSGKTYTTTEIEDYT